jgi:hypothetical protein
LEPVINDEVLLQWIKSCIEEGRYFFTDHALNTHPPIEGFRPQDVLEAIGRSVIVERRDIEFRCLLCGEATALEERSEFVGSFIHCAVQWDEIQRVLIITMYRPRVSEWLSPFRRRKRS